MSIELDPNREYENNPHDAAIALIDRVINDNNGETLTEIRLSLTQIYAIMDLTKAVRELASVTGLAHGIVWTNG